jgi:hypothetical protein
MARRRARRILRSMDRSLDGDDLRILPALASSPPRGAAR